MKNILFMTSPFRLQQNTYFKSFLAAFSCLILLLSHCVLNGLTETGGSRSVIDVRSAAPDEGSEGFIYHNPSRSDFSQFDTSRDMLLAQFDSLPDADDIHSQAALGSMLLHPDLADVEYYAVLGAIGDQSAPTDEFIDSSELMNLIYGPQGADTWTFAFDGSQTEGANWSQSVDRIKARVRTIIEAGGTVWVQEAGQSNITADWIRELIEDGVPEALIKASVIVIQHSGWNARHTNGWDDSDGHHTGDTAYVIEKAKYVRIPDGNGKNTTPDYHVTNTTFMSEALGINNPNALAQAYWSLADAIIDTFGFSEDYSSIDDGGVDFSDCVENWWIFDIGEDADTVRKFWDRYVVNSPQGLERHYYFDAVTGAGTSDFTIDPNHAPLYTYDSRRDVLQIDTNVYPDASQMAKATVQFNGVSGTYDVIITTMGEEDGESTYQLYINDNLVGTVQNTPTAEPFEIQTHVYPGISIQHGDVICVGSNPHQNFLIEEGEAYAWARARWKSLLLTSLEVSDASVRNTLIAVNCGGPALTADSGIDYLADQFFTGGSTVTTQDQISGTSDPLLLRSERYGGFSYDVPVANGSYQVVLQFAEIYATRNGQRVFDIMIEGNTEVDNLDIYSIAGHDAAYEVVIPDVVVDDGELTITVSASANQAKLSAFRIENFVPATSVTLINADTDADIQTISEGDTIILADLATKNVNIRADLAVAASGVSMSLRGGTVQDRTDSVAPYALWGDEAGDYLAGSLSPGQYALSVIPVGGAEASTFNFTVLDSLKSRPVADAGDDQELVLPTSSLILNGSGSDDGSVTGYSWTQVSGPNTATLSGRNTAKLSVSNLVAGIYVMRLTVTDNDKITGFDDVQVSVSVPPGDGSVAISGELKRWHRVDLQQLAVGSYELADPNPFRNYRMNVTFTAPSGKEYLVSGYFATDGNGGDSGNVWMAHLSPSEVGEWSYQVSFRSGADIAVSLDENEGLAVFPFDGVSGVFAISPSDKTGDDFRAADNGMLANRGHHYLTYGGSGKPFIYTGPGIPENILGYRGFTNTTIGIGHEFAVHGVDWNPGDPDWGNGDGRNLIGALNYIADQGGNSLYMMSNTIGGDAKDVFPHPTSETTKDRYDLLKLIQWDIALAHAQSKGILLNWHLAEHEKPNNTYYGGNGAINSKDGRITNTMTVERKLSFRMLNAVFGHYNGLKWNIMEETEFAFSDRTEQMEYIKAIDPYDHSVTYQVGGAGIPYRTYDLHLGQTDGIDAGSFQGDSSRVDMFNEMQLWRDKSAAAGVKWTVAWDEPQRIDNDNDDEVQGYPMGRRDKMWPCIMGGGDGFMWYIQQDGGGHGFDQRIADFTIMQNAFNWSGYLRDFLKGLPLLEMDSSLSLVNSSNGTDYTLAKENEVYAIFNDRAGSGMSLDLRSATGQFTVRWFNPRTGGSLQTGTVTHVAGGDWVSLGESPSETDQDWAVVVKRDDLTIPTEHEI